MPTEREILDQIISAADDETLAIMRKWEVANPADPEPMVICAGPDSFGVIGAMQTQCARCDALVWLSPSTQELLAKRGNLATEVICVLCLMSRMKESKP
jgi:hypothetical protein